MRKNNFFYHSLFLVTFILPFSLTTFAQSVDFSKLDRAFNIALTKFELPGMAIAIVENNEIVFQNGYGYRDLENKLRVTPNTNFAIASISKAFAAAAIAQLVEQGKLNWNDKVIDVLPQFRLSDPVITQLVTIEDLLCHRIGFGTFDGDLLTYGTNYSAEEVLKRIAEMPLKKQFRHEFGYSNIMYIAAGEIIKKISGKDWFDYVSSEFFKPLGMNKSVSSVRYFNEKSEVAFPYVYGEKDAIRNYDTWSSAASINSNIGDMSKWIKMWLNNGYSKDSVKILSPNSVKKLWTPHLNMPVSSFQQKNNTHFSAYALGWSTKDYEGVQIFEHGGGLPGYISKICVVPEKNFGFIILTNAESYAPYAIMNIILDSYLLGKPKEDWVQVYYDFLQNKNQRKQAAREKRVADRVLKTNPSHSLEEYTGIYQDPMYGQVEISLKGKQLTFVMLPTKNYFTSLMKHWHYNTFEVKFNDKFLPEGYVTFQENVNGKISGFTIDLPNDDFHFYNLKFKKL